MIFPFVLHAYKSRAGLADVPVYNGTGTPSETCSLGGPYMYAEKLGLVVIYIILEIGRLYSKVLIICHEHVDCCDICGALDLVLVVRQDWSSCVCSTRICVTRVCDFVV